MKSTLLSLVIATATVSANAEPRYEALAMIESAGDDYAVGLQGEISKFQIMRKVWKQYRGKEPTDPVESLRVAKLIMADRIHAFILENRREPNDVEVYLLWHRPSRYKNPTPKELDRAQRFHNLVEHFSRKDFAEANDQRDQIDWSESFS